jgi:hypothetical protein
MKKMVKYIRGTTHDVAVVERKCVTVCLKMLLATVFCYWQIATQTVISDRYTILEKK